MVALFGPNLARLEVFFLEVFWWWPDGGPNGGIFVARIWPDWRYSTWRYFSVARCWPGWRYFSGPVLARLEVFFLEVFFFPLECGPIGGIQSGGIFRWPEFGPVGGIFLARIWPGWRYSIWRYFSVARIWPGWRYFSGPKLARLEVFISGPNLARLEVFFWPDFGPVGGIRPGFGPVGGIFLEVFF